MPTTLTRPQSRDRVRVVGRRHLWNRALGERLERAGLQVQSAELDEQNQGDDAALTLFDFVGEETSAQTQLLRVLQEAGRPMSRAELTPMLLLASPGANWRELLHSIEPLLREGRADFVRLSPDQASREDAFEEVVERAHLLLQRRAFWAQSESPNYARQILAPFPAPDARINELHNAQSGRMDAKRVAAFFSIPLARLAKLLGTSSQAAHKTPDAPSLQGGLAPFHFVASALLGMFEEAEHARTWLHAPNEEFDGETPIALIKGGEIEVVAELLRDALVGQPG